MKKLVLLALLALATIGGAGTVFYASPAQAHWGGHHTS